jgi:hypothetical protein
MYDGVATPQQGQRGNPQRYGVVSRSKAAQIALSETRPQSRQCWKQSRACALSAQLRFVRLRTLSPVASSATLLTLIDPLYHHSSAAMGVRYC